MKDYSLTLKQVSDLLNRSSRTISRYVKQGRLNPQRVSIRPGVNEYRFSRAEAKSLKSHQTSDTPHDTTRHYDFIDDKPHATGHDTPSHTPHPDATAISELKDILLDQLKVKDQQINELSKQVSELIERNRETNILLLNLQQRLPELEAPGSARAEYSADIEAEHTEQETEPPRAVYSDIQGLEDELL